MSLLDWFKKKGETEASLKAKGINPFTVDSSQHAARAEDVRKAQAHAGDEWDVVDDPFAEAEAKRLAEEAKKRAKEEAARQEAERVRLQQEMLLAMQQEAQRIAQEEQAERLALAQKAQTMMFKARWDTFVRVNRQAHKALDESIQETMCWRCGQSGRLPVEDEFLFATPPLPTNPGDLQAPKTIQDANRLLEARQGAISAWKRYNDRRLKTELLRLDANYHPAIADRFQITRDCEICKSSGMFHAQHFVGTRKQIQTGKNSWRNEGEYSLDIRWDVRMGQAVTLVPGRFFGEDWVVMAQLTREQAKTWLRSAPRPETRDKEYQEYRAAKTDWDEKMKNGQLRAFDPNNPNSPSTWGRSGTHMLVTVDMSRKITHKLVSEPTRPFSNSELQKEWPNTEYWQPGGPHPAKWKGGPLEELQVKQGVAYTFDKQDPLSKEPRRSASAPVSKEPPRVESLQERKNFWASQG